MSIYIGNNKYKEIYLGSNKISEVYLGSNKIFSGVDPYNPLNLPANTVRVKTSDGNVPKKVAKAWNHPGTSYETATLVSGTTDVYDVYKSGTSFETLLYGSNNVIEVLGANTTGITSMQYMFFSCTNLTIVPLFDTSSVTITGDMFNSCNKLTSVPLFDTSNVTDIGGMFYNCFKLTSVPLFNTSNVTNMATMFYNCNYLTAIPLFDTSKVTDMRQMFQYCYRVESGALALYQQASTQTNVPVSYASCFKECGKNTTTGAAELAQIPSSWGGTAS